MTASKAPSVRRQRLGVALRSLREKCGHSAEMAGRRLGFSASKVSRIEGAKIGVSMSDVRAMLRLYKADDRLAAEILALAREAERRGWWDDYPEIQQSDLSTYIALEDEAGSVLCFQNDVVPGLLQSEDYALSLIRGYSNTVPLTATTIRRRLEVRLRRQRLIDPPRSLPISVVLDEAVLLRRIGTAATMARQLRLLVESARRPNVTLRVLPLDGDHGAGLSSFTLLEFPPAFDVNFPPIVHVESWTAMHAQDETVTLHYRLAHEWLAAESLGVDASLRLISRVAERWGAADIG